VVGAAAVLAFAGFRSLRGPLLSMGYGVAQRFIQGLMIFMLNARSTSQIPATAAMAMDPPTKTRRR